MKKYQYLFCIVAVIFVFTLLMIICIPEKNVSVKSETNEKADEVVSVIENDDVSAVSEKQKFYLILASDNPSELVEYDYDNNEGDGMAKVSDYVALSTHCLIGEFQKHIKVNDWIWEYEFKIKEKIYGKEDDEFIRIRVEHYGDRANGNLKSDSFIKGHNYILIVYRSNSIFLEYPRYSFCGYFVMDVDCIETSTWKNGTVYMSKGATYEDVINHIIEGSKEVGYKECFNVNYFRTEDIETVIKNCDAVFKINPRNIIAQGIYEDTTTYRCIVTENLKGRLTMVNDDFVYVNTFRNELETNNEYIIALSYAQAETFYHQASPICIFDASDKEMEAKIKEWLSEKNSTN